MRGFLYQVAQPRRSGDQLTHADVTAHAGRDNTPRHTEAATNTFGSRVVARMLVDVAWRDHLAGWVPGAGEWALWGQ